jgi:hypothetical protein
VSSLSQRSSPNSRNKKYYKISTGKRKKSSKAQGEKSEKVYIKNKKAKKEKM